jgi:hypothetical protein
MSPEIQGLPEKASPVPKTAGSIRWRKPATIILFLAYFLFVAWDGRKAPFAADDIQAIHTYWQPSPLRLLTSQFLLWRGYWRPMVGFFYLPIYEVWGLNPAPYHAVLLLLLAIGAYQLYRFASALGSGELPAAIAALIACYHGGLANLYYNTVFVGDVLCGIFYWAAFAYYARIRASGRLLNGGQTAAFLGLYLCALNSKEIAVTMPVMLLAYEWLYRRPPPLRWKEVAGWLRGPGRVLCLAGLLNVVCIYGKAFGQYGLMKNPAYRPVYSWARFADFQERYLSNIFYRLDRLDGLATCALWLVITYFAWRRNRPILRFCWIYVVLAPVPIEFLEGRGQANLNVTLAGWAVLAAALFVDWLPGAARVLSGEPLLRRLGEPRLRALLALAGMIAIAWGTWSYKETWVVPTIPKLSPLTAEVLAQFRAMNPRVRPGATVVFLEDPWPAGYDMSLIAELWFGDRKTHVYLKQKQALTPIQIAHADAVFSWKDGRLVRVQ